MRARDVQKIKRYSQRTLVVLLLGTVTFFFLRGAIRMYERYAQASEARTATVVETEALKERRATLEARIETLSTDRGLEEELRRRYGVAREGEGVIEVVADTPKPSQTAQQKGFMGWLRRVF